MRPLEAQAGDPLGGRVLGEAVRGLVQRGSASRSAAASASSGCLRGEYRAHLKSPRRILSTPPLIATGTTGEGYTSLVLSEEQIRLYRRMSVEERWKLTEELMTVAWRALLELPFEERERRLRLAREEHDASSRALEQALLQRS